MGLAMLCLSMRPELRRFRTTRGSRREEVEAFTYVDDITHGPMDITVSTIKATPFRSTRA